MLVNFSYVLDEEVAGLAHPDTLGDVPSALEELQRHGIHTLISLDEYGISPALAQEHGIHYLHQPIPDFHPPTPAAADNVVKFMQERRDAGDRIALHCRGGYGRTGTLIACYLISRGMSAEDAIERVRRRRPGSIETAGQEDFLVQFERGLRG